MNGIYKTLIAAAAALSLFASCVREDFQAGSPETDNYGVYFEKLTESRKSVEMDPSEQAVMTFKAYRTKDDGEIFVPVKLTATCTAEDGTTTSADDLFSVSPLSFEDGQKEAEFRISFKKAALGVKYSCSVECTDSRYTGLYSSRPTSFSFDVTRVKWNRLVGKKGEEYGSWTDDIVAQLLGMNCTNDRVIVYERDDKPGYYRMKDVYGTRMLYFMFDKEYSESQLLDIATPGTYTYVDATNPNKVFVVWGTTGSTISEDGVMWIGSYCPENGFQGKSYGVMENGVIRFSKDGLVLGFDGSPYGYMNSEKNVIVLPGYRNPDYSVRLSAGQSDGGRLPVEVGLGKDVVTAKYSVISGTVPAADVRVKALEVSRDAAAPTISASGTLEVECPETGVYTLVLATLDAEGAFQSYGSVRFSYVKAGDSVPVVINVGSGSAEKYIPQGYSPDSSIEVWCYGSDLVSIRLGIVKHDDYLEDPQACIDAVSGYAPVSDKILETINGEGLAAPVTGLKPGTAYQVIAVASNGYETRVFVPEAYTVTSGKALPIYDDYRYSDMQPSLLPSGSEGYFGKYNFYAVDALGDNTLRQYISEVTVADSDKRDETDEKGNPLEYVEISGMFSGTAAKYGFDDTMTWFYYKGYLYSLGNQKLGKGGNNWFWPLVTSEDVKLYGEQNGLIVGGFVREGYIAFVCRPEYASYGFNGFANIMFSDANYQNMVEAADWYTELLLVDKSVDDNGVAPSSYEFRSALRNAGRICRVAAKMPWNGVETAEGLLRSAIDGATSGVDVKVPDYENKTTLR